jgi:uncharacterized integral membrane protein
MEVEKMITRESSTNSERKILGRSIPQLIAWFITAAVLLIFVLENREVVRVKFLFWTVETLLVWALLTAAVLGFLLGILRIRITRR